MKTLNNYINEALVKRHIEINNENFVDLGLPSGNLWAKENYTENGAWHFFKELKNLKLLPGTSIPTMEDCQELSDCCLLDWDPKESQYIISGPNGNSINFKAEGFMDKNTLLNRGRESGADIWTSTKYKNSRGYYFNFSTRDVSWADSEYKLLLRLIIKK